MNHSSEAIVDASESHPSTPITPTPDTSTTGKHWGIVLALYLAGIAMGALDMGIVNPARTVIQNNLGVSEQAGVWVFTIYTLAYAVSIPIIGKLADLLGRKPVYILAIGLFGLGSLGAGLAQDFGSFPMLLASRVIQAIGGGGMMPVATAAVGSIVPPAKRGMALGLVGMVYGVASVFGGSAGSLILGIVGVENWQWIFYVNVPIAVVVVILGLWALPNEATGRADKLDLVGITMLVVMITAILWAFQHLNFVDIATSIRDVNVWAAFAVFAVLAPVFWLWERHMERIGRDPIINFTYFATVPVGATLLLGAVAGILMMSVMFIPQFAENSMCLPTGSGGYPTIIIGLASAIGAPISGRLTDQRGPRFVLGLGVGISVIAGLMLIYWASPHPGFWSASISIFVMGLGLGFLMGAPLTYLIMHLVPKRDANSGQATLSLIRSMGTVLAPAILVGFLATAMSGLGTRVMESLPEMPQASSMSQTMPADGTGMQMDLPPELQSSLQTADVTNIVARVKDMVNYMFDQQAAQMQETMGSVPPSFEQSRSDYLAQIDQSAPQIESTFQLELNKGFARMFWFYTLVSLAGVALLAAIPSKQTIDEQMRLENADEAIDAE